MGRRSLRRQLLSKSSRRLGLYVQRRKRARQNRARPGRRPTSARMRCSKRSRAPGNIGLAEVGQCLGEKLEFRRNGCPDSVTASISAAKYCAARRFA